MVGNNPGDLMCLRMEHVCPLPPAPPTPEDKVGLLFIRGVFFFLSVQ